MNYQDIKQMTHANYQIDANWEWIEDWIGSHKSMEVELEPDFQRAHVWTKEQQTRYIEFIIRGGRSGKDILWNCPGWMKTFDGPMVLVDGLQRLTAVREFLNGNVEVFGGHTYDAIEGHLPFNCTFKFYVNDLTERKDVLKWYLDVNEGGTDHTNEEILKVYKLLDEEEK